MPKVNTNVQNKYIKEKKRTIAEIEELSLKI